MEGSPGALTSWSLAWSRYFFLGVYLWVGPANLETATPVYQYLDNEIFSVPIFSRNGPPPNGGPAKYDERFPPPPLFPPPPPSWDDDTNALLREAVFANVFEKIKKTIKGDNGGNEGGNSHGSNNPGHKGNDMRILPTDLPEKCTDILVKHLKGFDQPGPPGPAGDPGPVGSRGRRGRRGVVGPTGPPGRSGPPGVMGPSGMSGSTGLPGLPGRAGPKGDQGVSGPQGDRGRDGLSGPIGPTGLPGQPGTDGMPGLVIFQNAAAMYGVALEGLLAYRADTKQLFFRDHVTWRAIRVTKCGDGIVDRETGEACDDGNDSPNDSCVGCRKAFCGDAFVHVGQEECDGRDFAGNSCGTWRAGMIGTLYCTTRCRISYSRCRFPRR